MRNPRSWRVAACLAACVALAGASVLAQTATKPAQGTPPAHGANPPQGAAPGHVMIAPGDLKWGDPPPVFEKGASFTVLSGDPGQAGIFVVRLKMPAGYKIAPHWHPTDEHVTVLSGSFALGAGDSFDKAALKDLAPGGYALLPAQMHHYAFAKTDAVVQVHGMGPLPLTCV